MEVSTKTMSTSNCPDSLCDSSGRCRLVTSPRCKAIFSDGRTCKLPCTRLSDYKSLPVYTDHCYRHGGRQEQSSYQRNNAQSIMSSVVDKQEQSMLSDLACTVSDASKDSHDSKACIDSHDVSNNTQSIDRVMMTNISNDTDKDSTTTNLHSRPNPSATGGEGSEDSTSTDRPTLISRQVGGSSEKSLSKFGSSGSEKSETVYSTGDPTLRKSFQHKLDRGQMNLNEELAMVRTLIQDIFKRMQAGTNSAEELRSLTRLLPIADKILNTIHRIEDTRKVQYTRESLRMDVMKVVAVIRRIVPEEPRRRQFATELAKILGPTLAESGDIVVSRETFKTGGK